MILNFNPLAYFDEIVDNVLQPISDENKDTFSKAEKIKKGFVFCQDEYFHTMITKNQLLHKTEGIFKKKPVSYLTFVIQGNEMDFVYKQIKKKRPVKLVKKDYGQIEFYFKKDKLKQ